MDLAPVPLLLFLFFLPKAYLRGEEVDRYSYRELHWGLLYLTVVSCALFLLFPTRVELRDGALLELGVMGLPQWLESACRGFYAIDGPFNAWPSLHISQPLLIMLAITQSGRLPSWKLKLLWGHLLLVCASVLTMKQHYLWDLGTGGLLALLYWKWFLQPRLVPQTVPERVLTVSAAR